MFDSREGPGALATRRRQTWRRRGGTAAWKQPDAGQFAMRRAFCMCRDGGDVVKMAKWEERKYGESWGDDLTFPRIVAPRYAFSEAWESKLLLPARAKRF